LSRRNSGTKGQKRAKTGEKQTGKENRTGHQPIISLNVGATLAVAREAANRSYLDTVLYE